jgi:hypothetical protein
MSRIQFFALSWRFSVLAVVALMIRLTLPTLAAHAQAPTLVDLAGGPYQQLEVVLRVDRAPLAGENITWTLAATPLLAAPDLTFTWELPDGGELLGGPAVESLGATPANQQVQQTRQVRFPGDGVYTVRGQATYHPNASTTLTAIGVLFVQIRGDHSTVTDVDPRLEPYTSPRAKPTIDKSGLVVAADAWGPNVPQGCFYVTGILTREERQPAANPPRYVDQTGSAVPVHHILVEMREEDTFSDDSYGFYVTDANGKFEFRFCDDDGFLNDELELYYRVCAEVWEGPNKIARIEHTSEKELYCFDSGTIDSEGGTVDFDLAVFRLNQTQSQVFNIADSLYWAWRYWNNNLGAGAPFFDRSVTVNWEGGKGAGSFYSTNRGVLVIAGDASSTDEWDDSVIIHEWGHFADHQFSCNQNPGGPHTLPGNNTGMNGDKLSWGEGFADYYQSAARTIMPGSGFPSFYIDVSGPTVDFEPASNPVSQLNEGAVAALLWDFIDAANDGSDTISHGGDRVLRVFTDPGFRNNTQCNMARFLRVWKDLGYPTDASTAATVVQNVNIANPFAVTLAAGVEPLLTGANVAATAAAAPYDYRWWDQVTMVVDNSSSMGQPAGTPKIDAVKALIREQVNDFTRNPRGTEHNLYTFNANTLLSPLAQGFFFLNQIDPVLNGLTATGADAGCPVRALDALAKAAENKYDGQAWVYTDGDAQAGTNAEFVRQQLTNRLLRGSIVLLGGCNSPPKIQSNVSGAEKSYLGLAADGSQSAGIVPYLLTALGTGGNFLYVPPDQLANATDILRAQASHSAGAGKWSDYVSDRFTYRWDRLEPGEYRWIPSSVMADAGQLSSSSPKRITLPQPFNLYGDDRQTVDVYEDGYIHMNPCTVNPQFCLFGFEQYLDILRTDLVWTYIFPGPNVVAAAPSTVDETGPQVHVYHGGLIDDQWYIVSTEGQGNYGGADVARRAYQAWLNMQTGEIRYLYDQVRSSDAAGAKIAVVEQTPFSANEVVVSNQDLAGAANGRGYKFIPAPPQPSKTYTVPVDSQVQSIGFLQTGYSGSFEPMVVRMPDGTAVDCADTVNVLCLSLNNGLVQYIQVNINDRTGVWTATVDAGPTGAGTFSFNALAASPIQPKGLGKHARAIKEHRFQLDLGRTTDNNVLTGWLRTATGARFGATFSLFDDGAHEDGEAGDGVYNSEAFTPPGRGVAYLWVEGAVDGETITRSEPAPYNFQPVDVEAEWAEAQGFLGSGAAVSFLVTNQDSVQRCYRAEISVPAGWSYTPIADFCVAPNATNGPYTFVDHPLGDQLGGMTGAVSATFTEVTEGAIAGGATAMVRLYRPLKSVAFDNRWEDTYLRPNGTDTVSLTVNLLDDQGQVTGWTGSLGYELSTTLGSVTAPTDGFFMQGRLPIRFTAGTETGEALITFVLEGSATTSTTLQIRNPSATTLDLTATPTDLSTGAGASALVATVRDAWGAPVAGQTVRLSVSDDNGDQGTINGGEVFTGTTDANGQLIATFVKTAGAAGTVAVRAETLVPAAAGLRTTHEDVEFLKLGEPVVDEEKRLYLPLVQK